MERQIVQGEMNIVGSRSMEIEPWEGEETQESNPKQMMHYNGIEPLQVDESISEEEPKEKATLWMHSNVIKLGKKFGAAFQGCEDIAYELMLRIDQRRGMEQNKKGNENQLNSKAVIPKEIRNLVFDMKFKEGEPRTRGRISHEGWS